MSGQPDNIDWSQWAGWESNKPDADRKTDQPVGKHRIDIGSVDKEIPELSDMYRCDFRTRIGKEWGEEFERKMFTYMLVMAIEEIYVYTETHEEDLKWTCEWHFSMDRPEGKECMQYNMHNLVVMSDEEFDRINKNTNYGLVKSWREIMRGKYDSK